MQCEMPYCQRRARKILKLGETIIHNYCGICFQHVIETLRLEKVSEQEYKLQNEKIQKMGAPKILHTEREEVICNCGKCRLKRNNQSRRF